MEMVLCYHYAEVLRVKLIQCIMDYNFFRDEMLPEDTQNFMD